MQLEPQPLDTLWGAKDIGAAIGLTERQAKYWLAQGELPGRRIGKGKRGRWCASRKALLAYVAGNDLRDAEVTS